MSLSYKVWLHVERLEDPDTEDEKYEDIITPVQLAHTSSLPAAVRLIETMENVFAGSIDD